MRKTALRAVFASVALVVAAAATTFPTDGKISNTNVANATSAGAFNVSAIGRCPDNGPGDVVTVTVTVMNGTTPVAQGSAVATGSNSVGAVVSVPQQLAGTALTLRVHIDQTVGGDNDTDVDFKVP